jgi:hypothetical protein
MTTTSPHTDRAPSIHEVDGLLDFIPVAGPPAALLVGPLVFLALLVAGPFVVIVTLAAVLVLAGAIVAIAGLILASPYLLVRHLRGRSAPAVAIPAAIRRPATSPVRPTARRVVA